MSLTQKRYAFAEGLQYTITPADRTFFVISIIDAVTNKPVLTSDGLAIENLTVDTFITEELLETSIEDQLDEEENSYQVKTETFIIKRNLYYLEEIAEKKIIYTDLRNNEETVQFSLPPIIIEGKPYQYFSLVRLYNKQTEVVIDEIDPTITWEEEFLVEITSNLPINYSLANTNNFIVNNTIEIKSSSEAPNKEVLLELDIANALNNNEVKLITNLVENKLSIDLPSLSALEKNILENNIILDNNLSVISEQKLVDNSVQIDQNKAFIEQRLNKTLVEIDSNKIINEININSTNLDIDNFKTLNRQRLSKTNAETSFSKTEYVVNMSQFTACRPVYIPCDCNPVVPDPGNVKKYKYIYITHYTIKWTKLDIATGKLYSLITIETVENPALPTGADTTKYIYKYLGEAADRIVERIAVEI